MEKRLKKSRYITGFDGIRTIAVVGVILYHLLPYQVKGGFLGVPIFFVLSGYLITDQLVQEWKQDHQIDVKAFYQRRFWRLYPALVTLLLATSTYITLFEHDLLKNIKKIILTNIFYIYNWLQISLHESYFDRLNVQSPFTHLWSLSIEGQFYLLWPVIIALCLKFIRKKRDIFNILLLVSLGSFLIMYWLYEPNQDPSRIYYGTDTRMFSILLGACLAFAWPTTHLREKVETKLVIGLNLIGLGALFLVCVLYFLASDQGPLLYRGGMYLYSVFVCVLVAVTAHPASFLNQLLTNPLFTWIGKRSYGIYLYQYPVMVFYESKVKNITTFPWLHIIIEIGIILLISELSYQLLEKPLKRGFNWNLKTKIPQVIIGFEIILFAITSYGMFFAKELIPKTDNTLQKVIVKSQKQTQQHNQQLLTKDKSNDKAQPAQNSEKTLTQKQLQVAQNLAFTAIGDSVLADTSAQLQQIFPKMYVDAKVGRQVKDALPIVQSLANQGQLADNILLVLGTNGPFNQQDLQNLMNIIGSKRKVYWLNVHVPTRRWQDQVNNDLREAAKQYHNIKVIDWFDYSQNHADWFYDDNIHPNVTGTKYFADFVAKEILN